MTRIDKSGFGVVPVGAVKAFMRLIDAIGQVVRIGVESSDRRSSSSTSSSLAMSLCSDSQLVGSSIHHGAIQHRGHCSHARARTVRLAQRLACGSVCVLSRVDFRCSLIGLRVFFRFVDLLNWLCAAAVAEKCDSQRLKRNKTKCSAKRERERGQKAQCKQRTKHRKSLVRTMGDFRHAAALPRCRAGLGVFRIVRINAHDQQSNRMR